MMMFCDNCEGQFFYKKTAFTIGRVGHRTTWTIWKCMDCGLIKVVTENEEQKLEQKI